MNTINKNTYANQQKLLLIDPTKPLSYQDLSSIRRKVFNLSPVEHLNFKTKLKAFSFPYYKYGKKEFGKKLLSRQRFKHIFKISDKQLKRTLIQKNIKSAEHLWKHFEIKNSISKATTLNFKGTRKVLDSIIHSRKLLSCYGLSYYLNRLSKNLIYLKSKQSSANKATHSVEYVNLLYMLNKLEKGQFLTSLPNEYYTNKKSSNASNLKNDNELIQLKTSDDTLLEAQELLASVESQVNNFFRKGDSIAFKTVTDKEYFKLLKKSLLSVEGESLHNDILNYTQIIKNLYSPTYEPAFNYFSKSIPHLLNDYASNLSYIQKDHFFLSADQREICNDILSQRKSR